MNSIGDTNSGALQNVHLATFDGEGYGEIRDAAIVWTKGRIEWLGPGREVPIAYKNLTWQDGCGHWLTPGLIDCHTHLVYAGNRAGEFEERLNGVSYETIAGNGGGILSTVHATRAASEERLLEASLSRIDALLSEGVTTIEIKSGYGLDLASERSILQVARRVAQVRPVSVQTTFLGAHAVPPEFSGRADDYIECVIHVLRTLHEEGLVDAVDAFCDKIAFSREQVERIFVVAKELDLPVKLHAEQLSNQRGAELVAAYGGLSADHLEWLDEAGITAMKTSGTIAVLLPGAYYYLRETKRPPIHALRNAGVPMAIGTDCNPGTSPVTSLLTAANMACVLFGMTPQESLTGITRNAARALGLFDRGRLAIGQRADMVLWSVTAPVELVYTLGQHHPQSYWYNGVQIRRPAS